MPEGDVKQLCCCAKGVGSRVHNFFCRTCTSKGLCTRVTSAAGLHRLGGLGEQRFSCQLKIGLPAESSTVTTD